MLLNLIILAFMISEGKKQNESLFDKYDTFFYSPNEFTT